MDWRGKWVPGDVVAGAHLPDGAVVRIKHGGRIHVSSVQRQGGDERDHREQGEQGEAGGRCRESHGGPGIG